MPDVTVLQIGVGVFHAWFSGHSRTGHTGHTARLASKLARLANRLPGTNVPGWNFGWPTPKFPVARPTLLIFLLIFPRLIFPRFSLAYWGSVDLLSRRPLGYATWVVSSRSSTHLASRARKSMKSLCSFRMRSTSTMFRCEKEVFTRGSLMLGVWLEVVREQENSNVHRLDV